MGPVLAQNYNVGSLNYFSYDYCCFASVFLVSADNEKSDDNNC